MPHLCHATTTPPTIPSWMAELAPYLPANYQEQARKLHAFVRVRQIATVDDLLRGLLCWAFGRFTFRQLGIWGTLQQVGALSDRAWSKRVATSHDWVLWLVGQLSRRLVPPVVTASRRIRVIDITYLRMRQARRFQLRVHTSYLLNEQRIDELHLTVQSQGETLLPFHLAPHDLLIADRAYCRRRSVQVIWGRADFLLRWHCTNFPLRTRDHQPFDILAWLQSQADDIVEHAISDGSHPLRVIALRLSPDQAAKARKGRQLEATRHKRHLQERTWYLAGWLILVTNLRPEEATGTQLVDLYRARWQVELLFKRLKQLLHFHRLSSFHVLPNAAQLALLLCGWLLLEAIGHQLAAAFPTSRWQVSSVLVRAFQHQLVGYWSLSRVLHAWPQLQRYLRRSRPSEQLWSLPLLPDFP